MTGEITLRGKVLPVGGIKMKALAAHRAGLGTMILPQRNERDLADIPQEIRKNMQFVLVDSIDDAIGAALTASNERPGAARRRLHSDPGLMDEEVLADPYLADSGDNGR